MVGTVGPIVSAHMRAHIDLGTGAAPPAAVPVTIAWAAPPTSVTWLDVHALCIRRNWHAHGRHGGGGCHAKHESFHVTFLSPSGWHGINPPTGRHVRQGTDRSRSSFLERGAASASPPRAIGIAMMEPPGMDIHAQAWTICIGVIRAVARVPVEVATMPDLFDRVQVFNGGACSHCRRKHGGLGADTR